MKRFGLSAWVLLLGVMLAGGCATPGARIKRSPEIFARLTPEQQALVKEGRVGIGFDADAVRLALGEPDRMWLRTDAAGTNDVWSYTTWENDRGQPLYRGWYHGYGTVSPYYYLNDPGRREHEYFKVVFDRAGKVTAIEEGSGVK